MFEQPKIGIVYRHQPIQLIVDRNVQGILWKFEHFHEKDVCFGPVLPLRDYVAVFFSLESDFPEIQRHLSNMFPGAELVGYRSSSEDASGILSRTETGLITVQLPMPFYLARHLLEDFSIARNRQRELAMVRQQADTAEEFFKAFVTTVESSSETTDRKLGMSLLVNKMLSNIQAEDCVLYLFGEGTGTLQRSYSTGNIKNLDLFEQHANGSIVEKVLQSGTPYLNNHYSFELKVPFSKDSVFIRSILCFPLQFQGERIGVIELINKVTARSRRKISHWLKLLSNPLAIAIQTLDLFEDAERITITDDLDKALQLSLSDAIS